MRLPLPVLPAAITVNNMNLNSLFLRIPQGRDGLRFV